MVLVVAMMLVTSLGFGPMPIPVAAAAVGDLSLASTSNMGTKGNGASTAVDVSADGTRVAFVSLATNLDPADTDATADVYVKDLVTGDIILVSTSDGGVKGNGASVQASISAEGTRAAFRSEATNLDPGDTDATLDSLREGSRLRRCRVGFYLRYRREKQ